MRGEFWLSMAAAAVLLTGCGDRAAEVAPKDGEGWTGVTRPRDVITARLELMEHIEELMEPIDGLQVGEVADPVRIRTHAEVIGAMLTALPHLFPPTTDLYDASALTPVTIALPAIWKSFDRFYAFATAASKAAEGMAQAEGTDAMRQASIALRGSCDACHALYLRKYEPPRVLDADRDFDFDSALPKH